jgi:hypothetical protein
VPGTAAIRDDVDVPVLIFETESDLTFLGYVSARQDDTRHVHAWEVAGTSHADAYMLVDGPSDLGRSPGIVARRPRRRSRASSTAACRSTWAPSTSC